MNLVLIGWPIVSSVLILSFLPGMSFVYLVAPTFFLSIAGAFLGKNYPDNRWIYALPIGVFLLFDWITLLFHSLVLSIVVLISILLGSKLDKIRLALNTAPVKAAAALNSLAPTEDSAKFEIGYRLPIGIFVGALVGYVVSYFFQPSLLRIEVSIVEYMTSIIHFFSHPWTRNTTISSTVGGAIVAALYVLKSQNKIDFSTILSAIGEKKISVIQEGGAPFMQNGKKFCVQCKQNLTSDAKFCPSCGASASSQ